VVEADAGILIGAAAGLAAVHAVIGIDHSIPFIVLKHARGWSLRKALLITGICGLGHVASSAAIGTLGVALGVGVSRLAWLEAARGRLAGWLLIAFGLAYAARSVTRAMRGSRHAHLHAHLDGTVHAHAHDHHGEHLHPHDAGGRRATPWVLFVVFTLGPCETLVPLMMAPAAEGGWATLLCVIAVFGAVTVATMLTLVTAGCLGVELAPRWSRVSLRHVDVLTGLTIAASGAAVMILGV
jgi:sulfite exporter TauE/SafE